MTPIAGAAARRPWQRAAWLGGTYFLLAVGAALLRRDPENVAFIWPANAAAVAVIARAPRAAAGWKYLAVAVATLLANLLAAVPLGVNLGATAGNLADVVLGTWLLRRYVRTHAVGVNLGSAARALAVTCLLAAPLGGLIGATAIAQTVHTPWASVFSTWYFGDIAGYCLLLVPGLAVTRAAWRSLRDPGVLAELSLQVLVLTLTVMLGWQVVRFPFVLIAVPATWVAMRNGLLRGTLVALVTLVVLLVTFRLHLWQLPDHALGSSPAALWFPSVAFILFAVQVGLIADDYREQARLLAASERRVASALEAAAGGFVVADYLGRVRLVNGRVTELLREPRTAILGNLWRDLLPTAQAEEILETTRRLIEAGTGAFDLEQAWPQPDGTKAWIHIRGSLLPDDEGGGEVVLQLDDVSARRVAEDRVRAAFEELTSIIDHIPAMIGYWDAENRNRFANPAYAAWFGLTPDALRGRSLQDALGERRWQSVQPLVAAMRGLQPQTFEGHNTDSAGQTRHLFATYLPNAVDGVFQGFAVIVSDITPVKVAQETLAAAKEQAEQASRQKSAFVANMSHEIRTPLNAILGAAWLLERHDMGAEQRQYLELIRTAGQSLLGLLNDVLDFSKIEAGKLDIAHEPIALDSLLASVAAMMVATAGTKDLELIVRVAPDVPRAPVGDALRLQQVLVNLVGNAIKFTATGEVELAVTWTPAPDGTPGLTFAVRDTGIGMSPEQQALIFAPFAQADASINRRFGGTGLGLAITRRLVEAMRGAIRVESALGQGTTFTVTLPLPPGDASAPPLHDTPRTIPVALVVDDSPAAGLAIAELIASWGWLTDRATSAADAWKLIRARQQRRQGYDLAVIDRQMPETDGLTMLAQLRADPWTRAWPTVLAERAAQWAERPPESAVTQADGTVPKPVAPHALAEVVHAALAGRHGAPALAPSPPELAPPQPLAGLRLMLVEDNPLNQVVARGVLEQAGAQIEVHDSGASALDRLRGGAQFAAILMDIQMPEMDGFTAAQLIRGELGLQVPIVALTAGVLPDERARCLAAGMDEFVPKPLDVPHLLAVLAHVTGRSPLVPPPARVPTLGRQPEEAAFAPDDLLAALGRDPESRQAFFELVREFIAEDVLPLARAEAAWQQGERVAAAAQLHALRGAVGTLGALQFAAVCRKLEQRLKEQPARVEHRHFVAARDALAQAVAAARVWLDEQPQLPVAMVAEPEDRARFVLWLRAQDFRACSVWLGVRPRLAQELAAADLEALDTAMAGLDFPAVLAHLARLGLA